MAIYNHKIKKYVAQRFHSSTGQRFVAYGRTKVEANYKLKKQVERFNKHKLVLTDRNTYARPNLATFINEEIAREEMEKQNETKTS